MNLLNYTLRYLAFALLGIISVWAVIFYINMLDEVYDSLDDGLDNYKMLILEKVHEDSATLSRTDFSEANYEIREITANHAFRVKDSYRDTLMYMMNEKDLEPVRMLTTDFRYKNRFYELKVISSMVEEDDLIEDLFFALIWLYVALIVSILVVNNFLLKKVWKPFYHLLEQLKHFQLGKGEPVKTAATDVKEFKELNSAVTSLVLHTLETYNSQKQFIENASHELQTPVAISIGKLEMLAEKNDLGEAGLESVGQVIQTLERLTRLNKSLLLLSKIENRQFPETEDVAVNDLFAELMNEFEDFAEYKNIAIRLHENSRLHVSMQKDLAAILLSNLLKNAIVHNHSRGSVDIYIEKDHFSISNSGNPEALDKDKIFRRFHKSSSGKNSTGLGLAIVKAITDLYGFGIEYVFEEMHTIKIHVKG